MLPDLERAERIAEEPGFPAPIERDGRGRLWSRREVTAWAKRWRREALALAEELAPGPRAARRARRLKDLRPWTSEAAEPH